MRNYPLWKTFIVFLIIVLGVVFAIPSIIYKENTGNWFLENKINLGLDLQGGSYLLLEVELEVLFKEELENFSDTIRLLSRANKVKVNDISVDNDNLNIRFASSEKLETIRKKFLENYRDVNVSINNNVIKIQVSDVFKKSVQEAAIKQSLEIVRKRVDESGTKEPLIQRSGKK